MQNILFFTSRNGPRVASRWRQDGARRARAKKERHYFYTGADIDHLLAQAAHTTGPGDGTVAEAVVSSKVTFHRAASVQLSVLGSCQFLAVVSSWQLSVGGFITEPFNVDSDFWLRPHTCRPEPHQDRHRLLHRGSLQRGRHQGQSKAAGAACKFTAANKDLPQRRAGGWEKVSRKSRKEK